MVWVLVSFIQSFSKLLKTFWKFRNTQISQRSEFHNNFKTKSRYKRVFKLRFQTLIKVNEFKRNSVIIKQLAKKGHTCGPPHINAFREHCRARDRYSWALARPLLYSASHENAILAWPIRPHLKIPGYAHEWSCITALQHRLLNCLFGGFYFGSDLKNAKTPTPASKLSSSSSFFFSLCVSQPVLIFFNFFLVITGVECVVRSYRVRQLFGISLRK